MPSKESIKTITNTRSTFVLVYDAHKNYSIHKCLSKHNKAVFKVTTSVLNSCVL